MSVNSSTYKKVLSKGKQDNLPEIKNGMLRFTTDTGRIYLDENGERIEFTDFVKNKTKEQILAIENPLPKVYLASDTHEILIYDTTSQQWVNYGGGSGGGLEAVDLTRAEYDALTPEEKADPNKLYLVDDNIVYLTTQDIQYDTTSGWASKSTLVSRLNTIYVYTDYKTRDNKNVPGFKVGDGVTYVNDLPFLEVDYAETANYATNASTAEFVYQADYATNAGTADEAHNSTYAETANYANNAGDAINAASSEYAYFAENAGTADYARYANIANKAENADNADTASYAYFSENADTATYANYAENAGTADYVSNADYANAAYTAEYAYAAASVSNAESADFASTAGYAQNAENASTASWADSADTARNAGTAEYASEANYANNAGTAEYTTSTNYADNAGTATYAEYASEANYAANAVYDITREGTTFIATKNNGDTFTFDQQDNNTTYDNFSTASAGLVPKSSGIQDTFLRFDGQWAIPSGGGGGGSNVSVTADLTTGTKIATMTIDAATTALYAPPNDSVIQRPITSGSGEILLSNGSTYGETRKYSDFNFNSTDKILTIKSPNGENIDPHIYIWNLINYGRGYHKMMDISPTDIEISYSDEAGEHDGTWDGTNRSLQAALRSFTYYGTEPPATSLGKNGSIYFRMSTSEPSPDREIIDIYFKADGVWSKYNPDFSLDYDFGELTEEPTGDVLLYD